ncbi:hypothetical protein AC249_AIPGENE24649 [Exaiptasia diaphana]|nr:hypothetical protein AC249_AIPGENE24649 [Exaiptasia diaphana]
MKSNIVVVFIVFILCATFATSITSANLWDNLKRELDEQLDEQYAHRRPHFSKRACRDTYFASSCKAAVDGDRCWKSNYKTGCAKTCGYCT